MVVVQRRKRSYTKEIARRQRQAGTGRIRAGACRAGHGETNAARARVWIAPQRTQRLQVQRHGLV